jgi:hypothetical protein
MPWFGCFVVRYRTTGPFRLGSARSDYTVTLTRANEPFALTSGPQLISSHASSSTSVAYYDSAAPPPDCSAVYSEQSTQVSVPGQSSLPTHFVSCCIWVTVCANHLKTENFRAFKVVQIYIYLYTSILYVHLTAVYLTTLGLGKKMFSSSQHPDRLWGPPSLLSNRYLRHVPGVKRPAREVDRSLQFTAKIMNYAAIPPIPHTS